MTDISRKAAVAKARVDPKVLKRTRQRRRRVLTFWRMCRYGINNFSRNTWLTIAATAVICDVADHCHHYGCSPGTG